MIRVVYVLLTLCVFASPISAGDPWIPCEADWGASCALRITICPQGDFELIEHGCGTDDSFIWARVYDALGNGIEGIPSTDFWLGACDPAEELCLCTYPLIAAGTTDALGYIEFTGRISGGGCATGGLYMEVQGKIYVEYPGCAQISCRNIVIVSPDLNADCIVNLSDLGVFGMSYNLSLGAPGYDTCCDFNDDDSCNLSDFAFMGGHYQHQCQ